MIKIGMFIIRCLLAGLAIAGCSSSSSAVNPFFDTITEGRTAVKEVMAETGATSISVALVDGNRVIWSEAFGSTDKEAGRSATTTTLYGAGSVSKMLATVAAMILVDRGKVSLDEPLTTYIRNFNMPLDQRYRDITVRMLLNHSSGLSGNYERGSVTAAPFTGYATQVMDGLKCQRLKHTPGYISAYNNDGFTMIENLVKAVTGQEYPDFVRWNILEPLGINSSQFQNVPLPDGSFARSYAGTARLTLYPYNVYAAGGFFSSPEEFARLATMLINRGVYGTRRILSENAVAAMAQDQRLGSFNPVPFEEYRFGLGWDTMAQPGLAAVGVAAWQKGGDIGGYYGSNMIVVPEEKLGVVVIGASNSFSATYAAKISERILFRALVERGKLGEMPKQLSTTSLPLQAVTAEEKFAFTGFYASSNGIFRLSFGSNDSLSVDELKTDWTPKYQNFKLRGDGWYAADGEPITAVRLLARAGRNYFAVRMKRGYGHYSITIMAGQRLEAKPAISAAWQARLNERWLPVNKDTYLNLPEMTGDPSFRFRDVTDLTGYLIGNNILCEMTPSSDDRLDGMFLTVPDGVKDMEDVAIENQNSQNWLRLGSYLYRPQSGSPQLVSGPATVAIGSNGFTEWRKLPSSGTIAISGSSNWFLYDADFKQLSTGTTSGAPSFSGSGAKYLALFGSKGSTISLNLTTP